MDTLTFIHGRLAQTTIFFALAMGIWAAWSYFRKEGVNSNYWGALIIGEILVIGQGVIGVLMVILGGLPHDLIHFLYGVLVALGWPAVYIYTNARATRTEAALYALVSFFIFGLAIRAIMTGG
jgi:heme A synthase